MRRRGFAWRARQEVAAVTSLGAPLSGTLTFQSAQDLIAKTQAALPAPPIAWRFDKRGRLRLDPGKPPPRPAGKKRPPPDPVLDRCLAALRALPPARAADALLPTRPRPVGATWVPDKSALARAVGLDVTALDLPRAVASARFARLAQGRATVELRGTFPIQFADGRSGEARVTLTLVRALTGEPFQQRRSRLSLDLTHKLPGGDRKESTTLAIAETVARAQP